MKKSLKNLAYYLSLVRMTDKTYFIPFFLQTCALVLMPAVNVLLPGILLADIMEGSIRTLAGDFGILAVISAAASFLLAFCSVKNSDLFVGLGFKLKEVIWHRMMTMPFADTENPEALNRLNSASSSVDRFVSVLHEAGAGLLANAVLLIFYMVLVIRLQPVLLLFPLVNIATGLWMENRVEKYEFGFREQTADFNRKRDYVFSLMYDYGYGKEIRLFGMKKWVLSIYRRYQREYEALLRRVAGKKMLAALGDAGFTLLRELAVYWCLILAYLERTLSVDEFVLYTGVFAAFATAGSELIRTTVAFAGAVRHIENYRDVAEEDLREQAGGGEEHNRPGQRNGSAHDPSACPEAGRGRIEFIHVSFRYPGSDRYVLKDFSCVIPAGAHVALVGENGAGKSTIVKLLCGFYENYEGTIRIDGVDLADMPGGWRRERIAAVFQESRLLPATLLENITLQETCTQEETERATDALRLTGLYEKTMTLSKGLMTPVTRAIEDDGVELSGGEKQRLMMCRALYKGGDILLLDEPTSALDALAEQEVYDRFHMISEGRTTLFVSHRLNSTRFCDEIWMLEQGRIMEKGSHRELYEKKGAYYRLFATQAKYYQKGGAEHEKA